jgi:hypothetical protein
MAVYSVEGKLGTGKTKFAVWRASEALAVGRRVASNVDLKPELLAPYISRPQYIRVPDKPTAADLEAIGHGNPDSYDEERNGVLILDELGTWLNSRSFQDASRAGVIDWLIHARKHGWDVYLIVQDANMIDRQVREALIEFQCRCIRADKLRIPVIGGLLACLPGVSGYMPRIHLVTARMGYGPNAVVAERWMYRGDHLHAAYDTRQVFRSDYAHGVHCVLPPAGWTRQRTPGEYLAERLAALRWLAFWRFPGWVARCWSYQRSIPSRLRDKLRPVVLASGLPRDEAWRAASRYARALDRAQG